MGGLQKELPERGGNTWIWEVVPTALTYFVFDLLSNLSDFFLGVFCQNVQLISNEVQPVLPIFSLLHGMDSTPAERKSPSPPCIPPGKNRPLARHGAPSWWFLSSQGECQVALAAQSRGTAPQGLYVAVTCAPAFKFKGCAGQTQLKPSISSLNCYQSKKVWGIGGL